MKRNRRASLRKIISNLNLSEIEEVLTNCYNYIPGKPGRPPLPPTGMFLSFILMFLRMESYRDYQSFIEKDQFWRRQLGFVQAPDIGSFTHFLQRIGVETFKRLFNSIVQQLINKEFLCIHFIAQDGSLLEGNRDDVEADWGWDHIKERYVYGYKIHVIVDTRTELPIALNITKANVHDSRQYQKLYGEIKSYDSRHLPRFFTGDKAFDSSSIRKILLADNIKPIVKASKVKIKPSYSP